MKQMVKVFVAAAVVLGFAVPASAQGTGNGLTVGAGLSFLSFEGDFTPKGINLQIAKAIKATGSGSIDVVGDLSFLSDDLSVTTFGAGVRGNFAGSGNIRAFVQFLIGAARFSDDIGTEMYVAPGGGIIFRVNDKVSVFGQYDFFVIMFEGDSEKAHRLTFGVMFNVGG